MSNWKNYKSDKWKSKRILLAEIIDNLDFHLLSKKKLIEIKNYIIQIKEK